MFVCLCSKIKDPGMYTCMFTFCDRPALSAHNARKQITESASRELVLAIGPYMNNLPGYEQPSRSPVRNQRNLPSGSLTATHWMRRFLRRHDSGSWDTTLTAAWRQALGDLGPCRGRSREDNDGIEPSSTSKVGLTRHPTDDVVHTPQTAYNPSCIAQPIIRGAVEHRT